MDLVVGEVLGTTAGEVEVAVEVASAVEGVGGGKGEVDRVG